MIQTRNQLKECLDIEKNIYFGTSDSYRKMKLCLLSDHDYLIWKFVKALRFTEYHYNAGHKIMYYLWQRYKNRIGARLGLTMWHNTIEPGIKIWHYGSVIVNGHAKIGQNCQLHGENCIGNKGDFDNAAPTLGNNVDVGIGAKVIGDIYIADDVKIGANAVVTKSCYKKGAILVGVPAREVK